MYYLKIGKKTQKYPEVLLLFCCLQSLKIHFLCFPLQTLYLTKFGFKSYRPNNSHAIRLQDCIIIISGRNHRFLNQYGRFLKVVR